MAALIAAQAAAAHAAIYAAYAPLTRPGIRPDIFLIIRGEQATAQAIRQAIEAAALYASYHHRAEQLQATAAHDRATEALRQATARQAAAAHDRATDKADYGTDKADYDYIKKAARIAEIGTEAALKALFSSHAITRRDYEAALKAARISNFAAFMALTEGRQSARIPGPIMARINAYLAAQARTGTGRTSQAGLNKTGGLYAAQAAQDIRRRITLKLSGGVRSIPIKKAAYDGLKTIQTTAALLDCKAMPPIMAAREAAISREAAAHIRAESARIPITGEAAAD